MSYDQTSYIAKPIDANGNATYTDEENAVWHELITRQDLIIQDKACGEYVRGLQLLKLPKQRIPQCHEVSTTLKEITGWELEPVPALISFDRFFYLLANRKFPAATFIRRKEELDYIKEPDIFHEVYGHCPLLTNPAYAEFVETYGKLGLKATPEERVMLARLFWFTIEFGLINTASGIRAYGGGILSSMNETVYCIESKIPQRAPFDVMQALCTPYRIDVIQPLYFVLDSFDQLYQLIHLDLIALIHQAHALNKDAPKHPC